MSDPHHIDSYRPDGDKSGGRGRIYRWMAALGSVAALWLWKRRRGSSGDDVPSGVSPEELERGHVPEGTESARGVGAFAAGLLVLICAVLGIAALLINIFDYASPDPLTAPDAPFSGFERMPTESPLQVDPAIDLLRVRKREHETLTGYRWVDRQRGIVSIPIERAMDLMAARKDTVSRPDSARVAAKARVRLITESGYTEEVVGVPEPGAPPYLGLSPERYTVSPEFARELGLINSKRSNKPLD